jgi:hypothetical protein
MADPSTNTDTSIATPIATYVEQTIQLLNLPVPPEQMPRLIDTFQKLQSIAAPMLAFELPDNLEALPVFEP